MATQSQSPDFVTQATNFVSAISGAVDPRTGLYGLNINLGTFVGNRALGPHLPLSLRYSPLNGMDFGLGKGFKLAVTAYNEAYPRSPEPCCFPRANSTACTKTTATSSCSNSGSRVSRSLLSGINRIK